MFCNKYPYSNLHDLNLDWIIMKLKEIESDLDFVIDNASLKYADPIQWNITRQYQANTVVIDPATGIAYLSTKPVPNNILITDTDYWTPIFDLSNIFSDIDQIEQDLADEVQNRKDADNALSNDIQAVSDDVTAEETARINADNALSGDITAEETARIAADNALQNAINNIKGTYINVKNLGVVGDGVTDDTAAINAALASGPGMYYFPAGTYLISGTILMPAHTGIIGEGIASIIETNSVNDHMILTEQSYHIIKDITLNTRVNRSTSAYAIVGKEESRGENLTVENVNIFTDAVNYVTGNGIKFHANNPLAMVSNCRIEIRGNCNGIDITGGNDRFISNNWIRGGYLVRPSLSSEYGIGININGTEGDFFSNNDVVQFSNDLMINTTAAQVQAAKFTQCLFDSSKHQAVRIFNNQNRLLHCVTFVGCWFGSAGMNEVSPTDAFGVSVETYSGANTNEIMFDACTWHSNRCHAAVFTNSGGAVRALKVSNSIFEGNGSASAGTYMDITSSTQNFISVTGCLFNQHQETAYTLHNVEVRNYSIVCNNIMHASGDPVTQVGASNQVANNITNWN